MRHLRFLLVLPAFLLFGCGSDNPAKPSNQQQPTLANNDTPQNAILRLVGAYEQKRAVDYSAMFTTDFTYEFSNSTDPDLVTKYSTGWFKADEQESSSHLFGGFTPPGGTFHPPASTIDLTFATTLPVDDSGSADPQTHKVLFTRVDGSILVPPAPGQNESTMYLIDNNQNSFYLVRGDKAVGLDSDQPADSTHWYIYRWVDLTGSPAPDFRKATIPSTWGKVKALYQ